MYIQALGNKFESVMDEYFDNFKIRMNQRFRISPALVEKYHDYVYFLDDIDSTLVKAILSRVAWLEPMDYEVNIDQDTKAIKALLKEPVEK